MIFLTLGTGVGSGVFVDGEARPEHRVRPDGDPRARRRAAVGRRGPGPARACRGRPGRRTSTSTCSAIEDADLADAVHPRRRRQQERRPVHPAADRADAGRPGPAAQRRRDHRRRDRRGRVAADAVADAPAVEPSPPASRRQRPSRRRWPSPRPSPRRYRYPSRPSRRRRGPREPRPRRRPPTEPPGRPRAQVAQGLGRARDHEVTAGGRRIIAA